MDNLKSSLAKRFEAHQKASEKRRKWSHSPSHDLADEMSRMYGEPKRFAMYLGAINKIGVERARQLFSEINQSDCDSPGKLFFWKVKDMTKDDPKKPRVKKPAKKKPAKQLPLI